MEIPKHQASLRASFCRPGEARTHACQLDLPDIVAQILTQLPEDTRRALPVPLTAGLRRRMERY